MPQPTSIATRRPVRGSTALAYAVAIAALVATGLAWSWHDRQSTRAAATPRLRLVVLPFGNLGDSTDRYIAEGFSDALRDKLAAIPGVEVIGATSSARYRTSAKTAREIAADLEVRYLLTGSVHWSARPGERGRLHVEPELIDATSGGDSWSAPYDTLVGDVFHVQSSIAAHVATAIGVTLDDRARHAVDAPATKSVAAYDAFLRGRVIAAQGADAATTRRAIAAYTRAVSIDPSFALAWSNLSAAWSALWAAGASDSSVSRGAQRAADRALALAPTLAEAHGAIALYDATIARDNAAALREYGAALRYAPNDPTLLVAGAMTDRSIGRWDNALARLAQAERVDPYEGTAPRRRGTTLLRLRRYPEAERELDRALALAPASAEAISDRALAEIAQGRGDRARAIIQTGARTLDSAAFFAYVAGRFDVIAMLDSATWRFVSDLPLRAFHGDRAAWGAAVAEAAALAGDSARARAFADTARLALEPKLRATPDVPTLHASYALALARLGHTADAIREGERAVTLAPPSENTWTGPTNQQALVRVYLIAGERAKALNLLETLLSTPALLSPGWLRIDPTFAALHGDPRFDRLAAGTARPIA